MEGSPEGHRKNLSPHSHTYMVLPQSQNESGSLLHRILNRHFQVPFHTQPTKLNNREWCPLRSPNRFELESDPNTGMHCSIAICPSFSFSPLDDLRLYHPPFLLEGERSGSRYVLDLDNRSPETLSFFGTRKGLFFN